MEGGDGGRMSGVECPVPHGGLYLLPYDQTKPVLIAVLLHR